MYCICSNDEMKVNDYSVVVLFILIELFIGHDYVYIY